MPRSGQNPMRWTTEVYRPRRVTVTALVFIPELEGYWAESLEVLELCLLSLRKTTEVPFDLLVLDNGSCPPVRRFLEGQRDRGAIQILVLSDHNLGKTGAWNVLFAAAPGDVVVYTDSDVLFQRDWLEQSLAVLEAFPEAGMITAQPARRGLPRFCRSTLERAEADPGVRVERGDLLPPHYLRACAYGLGRTLSEHAEITAGQEDVLLVRGDARAYVSADHFQFLTTRKALAAVGRFDVTRPLGPEDDQQLDERIDASGFWRLSTTQYLVHHLGNRVGDLDSLRRMELDGDFSLEVPTRAAASGKRRRGISNRRLRELLKRLNRWTFRLLYPQAP